MELDLSQFVQPVTLDLSAFAVRDATGQVERVRVRARRPADLQLAEVIPRAAGRQASQLALDRC